MSIIALYLMSEKGLAILNTVVKNNLLHLISHVIVGTDKNVINDFSNEIIHICKIHRLPWSYKNVKLTISTEYSFAVSWRWMLPTHNKLLVFHDSPLPRHRGFAPLVSQLIEAEKEIGVTALFGSEKYDHGDIVAIEKVNIDYPITIQEAIKKSLPLYEKLAFDILKRIDKGEKIIGIPQNEDKASYSLWRDDLDYFVDWTKDAQWIERFVNAVGYPFLGAKAFLNGEIISLKKVQAKTDIYIHNRQVGKVIFIDDGIPVVVCHKGLLLILEANFVNNGQSILPLTKFRSRLT